jgi:hypothetical protein
VFDVIRVAWVTMICCILFLDLPLTISFLIGLVLGLVYVGCRASLHWRAVAAAAAAAQHQELEGPHPEEQQQQHEGGAGEGDLTAPLLEGEEAV